jgi:hypothetical protein
MRLDLAAAAGAHRVRVGALPPALRGAAQRTWRGRMINEHGSAPVFAALADHLREAGAAAEHADACARFADEERTHGALCAAVLQALGGDPRAEVAAPGALPRHADVAPVEAVTRNIVSVSCLSETVAVAILTTERCEMPEGDLRDVISRILADEIGHARFGWRWLAEVAPGFDAAARARLGAYLRVAFAALERHELDHVSLGVRFPAGAAAYGLCDGDETRALFYETVDQVILPQLEAHGLPARAAWDERPSLG